MKTKVILNSRVDDPNLRAGDLCFIDEYIIVAGKNYCVCIRESDGVFGLANINEMRAVSVPGWNILDVPTE